MSDLLYDGWMKIAPIKHGDKTYEKLMVGSAVSGIVYHPIEKKVMLVKQFRPAVGNDTWEMIAGLRDVDGEDPEDNFLRELYEEAGIPKEYVLTIGQIGSEYNMMIGCTDATMTMFLCILNPAISTSEYRSMFEPNEETTRSMFFNMSSIAEMITCGIITDSKTIMSFLLMRANKDNIENIVEELDI